MLTPNCLVIGRAVNKVPDDTVLGEMLKGSKRYQLIQQATAEFWRRWASEVTPEAIVRQKWHESNRNLTEGDIVLVHDSSPIKGKYVIAMVDSVKSSRDGRVRSVVVKYRIPNQKDLPGHYSGGTLVKLTRSVQRLSLLLSKEEQCYKLDVGDGIVKQDLEDSIYEG